MMPTDHAYDLRAFVNGQLAEVEADAIIDHLVECEQCLVTIDQLWHERQQGLDTHSLQDLDSATAKRVEARLLNQIHRSGLSAKVVWLGTAGLVDTTASMLGPMFDTYLTLLRPFFQINKLRYSKRSNK